MRGRQASSLLVNYMQYFLFNTVLKQMLRVCLKYTVATTFLLAMFTSNAFAEIDVEIFYIMRDIEPAPPLSLVDMRVEKDGLAGARLGLNDNKTTGSFLGHKYKLVEVLLPAVGDVVEGIQKSQATTPEIIIANLDASDLLRVTDAYPDAMVLNVYAPDDRILSLIHI